MLFFVSNSEDTKIMYPDVCQTESFTFRTAMGKMEDFLKDTTDCDRPACDDMMSKLKKAAQAAAKKTKKMDCPLGTADMGRSSWGLLHSMVRNNGIARLLGRSLRLHDMILCVFCYLPTYICYFHHGIKRLLGIPINRV